MSVSVVIPHYYPERDANLTHIITALRKGSVPPDEIIIWANSPIRYARLAGASVIQSHRNVGAQARFVAALTAVGDYVVFHDNDVMAGHRSVEQLLWWSQRVLGSIVSADGRVFAVPGYKRYTNTVLIQRPEVLTPVDISLGHLEMVRRTDVPKILSSFPFGDEARMDDLQWSAAAARAGVPIYVAPGIEMTGLSMGGVGSCKEPDHYRERDRLCQTIFGEVATA